MTKYAINSKSIKKTMKKIVTSTKGVKNIMDGAAFVAKL